MNVRPCTPGDAAAIERLFQEFVEYLRGIGDRASYVFSAAQYLADGFGPAPAFRGLVAEDDAGAIAGYVLFSPVYDGDYVRGFYIADVYVRQASRGEGTGRMLMKALQELAKKEGRARLTWSVHHKNARAIHFYESICATRVTENDVMFLDVDQT